MVRIVLVSLLCLLGTLPAISFAQERIWKDSSGSFSVKAEFLGIKDGKVQLRRSDNGKLAEVPLIQLSDEDRQFLIDLNQPKSDPVSDPKTPPSTDSPPPKTPPGDNPPAGSGDKETDPVSPAQTGTNGEADSDTKENPESEEPATPPTDPGTLKDAAPIMPFRPATDTDREKNPSTTGDGSTQSENPASGKSGEIPRFSRSSQGDQGTGDRQDETANPVENPSTDAGQSDVRMALEMQVPVIDAANMRLENLEPATELAQRSDEQLIAGLRLSAGLAWKGNTRLNPLLQSRPSNLELTINVEADCLTDATNTGFVAFQAITDDADREYQPVALPPAASCPVRGWVSIPKTDPNDPVPLEGKPTGIGVELERPATPLESLKTVSGNFRIEFGLTRSRLTISNIAEDDGRLEHPILDEKGMRVIIRHPDQSTLVVEVTGNIKDLADVRLTSGNPAINQGKLYSIQSRYHQFDFVESIPPNVELVIEIVGETREITVPFEFQDVRLQVAPN